MITSNQFRSAAGASSVEDVPAPAEEVHGPHPVVIAFQPTCKDGGLYLAFADQSSRPAGSTYALSRHSTKHITALSMHDACNILRVCRRTADMQAIEPLRVHTLNQASLHAMSPSHVDAVRYRQACCWSLWTTSVCKFFLLIS